MSGWSAYRGNLTSPAIPVTLTIRDLASGETGDISLSYKINYNDNTGSQLYLDADDFELLGRVTLGDSVYEFRDGYEGTQGMTLTVSAASVTDTPEPATLVLAGLGLAAAGVRRLRRSAGRATPAA